MWDLVMQTEPRTVVDKQFPTFWYVPCHSHDRTIPAALCILQSAIWSWCDAIIVIDESCLVAEETCNNLRVHTFDGSFASIVRSQCLLTFQSPSPPCIRHSSGALRQKFSSQATP